MRVKDCKEKLDLILAIEEDELTLEDEKDLKEVLDLCRELMTSQRILWKTL